MFAAVAAVLLSVLLAVEGSAHSLQDLQNLRFPYDDGRCATGLAPSKAPYRVGDMIFDYDPFHRKRHSRAATARRERIWPHGIIPYEINGNFSGEHKTLFQKAMRHWENFTCLSFVPREPSHENYIVFTVDKCGCCSYVGRRGEGPQAVSIGKNCDKLGIVIHELGHAVGFWHEHTRPDREKYVDIFYSNIQHAQDYNFDKSKVEEVDSLGEIYDYASIMHYARDTFAKAPYLDTILPKKGFGERPDIGQRIKLSDGDVRQTNKLYRCPTCGRTLLDEYGQLSVNQQASNCQWRVVAAQGEVVLLNISTSFLPLPSSSCAGERDNFVIIRDGYYTGSPIIDKLCGGVRSKAYASTGNRLFVQLKKHPSVPPPAVFAEYAVVCGGSLSADEGFIESPRFPEYYSSDANCMWAITVPAGFRVAVKFHLFHVEQHKDCIYDRLEFYEGHVERSDRLLGRLCGIHAPDSIQTVKENQMLVKFVSDSSVQKPGFKFEFVKEFDECASGTHECEHRCVNQIGRYTCECVIGYSLRADGRTCESTCGGFLKARNGIFQSPNFPVRYEPNTECSWEIEAEDGYQIIVNFTHFNVEGLKTECAYDYLKIGRIAGSQNEFDKFCGDYHHPLVITSLTNKLRVTFVSDSSVEKTGFGAYFITDFDECQYGQNECDQICVNTIGSYECHCENGFVLAADGHNCKEGGCSFQLNDPSGVITSPNFPDEYSNFKRCQWHFVTTPGHRLSLRFDEFVLEDDRSCSYDRVEVFDGGDSRSSALGAFCGVAKPPSLISTSNQLFVVMSSDSTVTRRGFRAFYESECGGLLTAESSVGYIYSHARYSDNKYDKKLTCRWEIAAADRSQGVELRFTQFAVEMGTSCEYDFVAIYDGAVATENNKFGQFCGDKIPPMIVSTSQVVMVEFITDDSVEQKGFVLEYRATTPSGKRNLASVGMRIDGANWMSRLPRSVTSRSIRDLKIPGSHDSAAFELFTNMKCATDNNSVVQFIGNNIPPSRRIIRRWAITQHLTVAEQLNLGIRYLDLRVSRCVSGGELYRMVHTLFGRSLEGIFESVKRFLDEHPEEFVILDINHVYCMRGDLDIDFIISLIHRIFGKSRMCPPTELCDVSLDYLRENNFQFIVLLDCEWKEKETRIWCQDWIRSPYANTNQLKRLFPYIESHLKHACRERLHVTQGILTPRTWDIVKGIFLRNGSLEYRLADECTEATLEWINRRKTELNFNIVICDFVEKYEYCLRHLLMSTSALPTSKKHYQQYVDSFLARGCANSCDDDVRAFNDELFEVVVYGKNTDPEKTADARRRYYFAVLCDEFFLPDPSRGLNRNFVTSYLQQFLLYSTHADTDKPSSQLFYFIVEGIEAALQKFQKAEHIRNLLFDFGTRLGLSVFQQTLLVHSLSTTSLSTECLKATHDLLKALVPLTVQSLLEDNCSQLQECKHEFAHLFLSIIWNPTQPNVRPEDVTAIFSKASTFKGLKSDPIFGALLSIPRDLSRSSELAEISDVDDAFLQPLMEHLGRDNVLALAAQIREIGFPFTKSVDACVAHFNSFNIMDSTQLTSTVVSQVVTMMVTNNAEHKSDDVAELCYDGRIFSEAVNRINPSLSWGEVIAYFDKTLFGMRSRQMLKLLTEILVTGISDPNSFPSHLIYTMWPNNKQGQFTWLQLIIQNPDVFFVLDFPHSPVNISVLKIQPDELSKDVVQWKCLSLVETLLKLAETQFQPQVFSILCALPVSPLAVCPDLLLLGLIQANVPMRTSRQRLVQECVTALLSNSQNAIGVLNAAWNCELNGARVLRQPIILALLMYYSKSPDDQSRLTKILEIGHELKPNGLGDLLAIPGQYPFVIDLACLASKRDYLKLDKWIDDKMLEIGVEQFAMYLLQHIKRRIASPSTNLPLVGGAAQLAANQDTLLMLLGILQQKNLHSPELVREMQGLTQQLRIAQAKNGSAPRPITLPPNIPLGLNLSTTPGTPTGPPPAGSPLSLMSQQQHQQMYPGANHPIMQRNSMFGPPTNGVVQRSSSVGPPQTTSFGISNTPPTGLSSGFGSGPGTPPNPAVSLGGFPGGTLSPSHTMMRSGSQSFSVHSNVHRGPNATTPSMPTPPAPFAGPSGWDLPLSSNRSGSGASTPGSQAPIDFRSLAPSAAPAPIPGTPPLLESRLNQSEDNSSAIFSEEIQEEANTYFQMIYAQSQQMSVDQFIQKLKQFKVSQNVRDQEILACVIKNLFDEFRFFHEYPERELKTTAEVYGGIIRENIIDGLQLATAMRRIAEALSTDHKSMLFQFAAIVLSSCKMRLHQFAAVCLLIQKLDNFGYLPAQVREFIGCGSSGQIPAAYQQQFNQMQKQQQAVMEREKLLASQRNPAAQANHGRETPPGKLSTSSRAVSTPSGMLNQASVDTLVKLTEREGANIPEPSMTIVEKVSFLFNNLSQSNLVKKTEEMRHLMAEQGDNFVRWVAQYMVMKRVSIEFNFHPLYSNFVNSIGDKNFEAYVRKETFRNIKVLLKCDKRTSASNFSDRQLLKHLGNWLGLLTIAKDKPIETANLDLKSLLLEAYYKGQQELLYVVPFIAKIVQSCAKSLVFSPRCAWMRAILSVLAELHNEPDLKLNLKFEIEVLCKELGVDLADGELGTEGLLKNTERLCKLRQQLGDLRTLKQPDAMGPPPGAFGSSSVMSSSASPIPNTLRPVDLDGGASSGRNSANICTPVSEMVSAAGNAADPSAAAAAAVHTAGMAMASSGTGSTIMVNNAQFHYHDINVTSYDGLVPHLKINSHLALFQAHPNLKHAVRTAIHHAVKELTGPITVGAIKVAMTTTEQIVRKDFILDGEEKNIRRAAHQMMRAMTAGMAAITCREPLATSIANYLKQCFVNQLSTVTNVAEHAKAIDEAIQEITADNVELATSFIVKAACEKASQEVDKKLAAEFEARTQAKNEHQRFIGSQPHYEIQQLMPGPIRTSPGPISPERFEIYDQFLEKICGFKAASVDDMLLDLLAKNSGGVGGAAIQHSQMVIQNTSTFVADMKKIVDTIEDRANHIGQTSSLDEMKSFKALLTMKDLFTQAIAYPGDARIINPLLQRVVEQFLYAYEILPMQSPAASYSKMMQVEWSGFVREAFTAFCKCLANHIPLSDIISRITQIVVECRQEFRFNVDAISLLLRNQLIKPSAYDKQLSVSLDSGNNYTFVQFVAKLFRSMHEENMKNDKQPTFPLQTMMPLTCEVLSTIQSFSKGSRAPAAAPATDSTAHPLEMKASAPAASEELPTKRISDATDPDAELQLKVENILKSWMVICAESDFQKDPQTALHRIVSMMHERGVLSTDEMITRFLRMCTDMIVEVSYRCLKNDSTGNQTRRRIYSYLDAFVQLTTLMIKYSDSQNHLAKVNLLKKVLSIIIAVAVYDHDQVHKQDFQALPYHRMLIGMFNELTVHDPALEPVAWNILEHFGQALFTLQPRKAPGFAFSWLDIVGHRNFIARILTRTGESAERARAMYTQLIILLLKFLSPYLRNLTLPATINSMYMGTLRVLLVILHDFPEVLCEYHYFICDSIPPNCIQLRNLVLSAYPRGMKLPDPFSTSTVMNLPEMQEEPKINRLTDIFRALETIRHNLDQYLQDRSPVSFLSELPQVLQVSSTPGSKYNMSVINSIVLYVGIRAVESIRENGHRISLTTIAHSSFMDVFQNLSVLFCTEGRYLLFNAIANQLRYPNAHTNYFSQTLLYLFREANSEEIQEQITRILFERLIAIRPHPWGLLITFIELIRNESYGFWKHDFVRCSPEIEGLFQTVANSCYVRPQQEQSAPSSPQLSASPPPRPATMASDPIIASSH